MQMQPPFGTEGGGDEALHFPVGRAGENEFDGALGKHLQMETLKLFAAEKGTESCVMYCSHQMFIYRMGQWEPGLGDPVAVDVTGSIPSGGLLAQCLRQLQPTTRQECPSWLATSNFPSFWIFFLLPPLSNLLSRNRESGSVKHTGSDP